MSLFFVDGYLYCLKMALPDILYIRNELDDGGFIHGFHCVNKVFFLPRWYRLSIALSYLITAVLLGVDHPKLYLNELTMFKGKQLKIIRSFVPTATYIHISDLKLYNQILRIGKRHVLSDIIPTRSHYSTRQLRPRLPPMVKRNYEQELTIFPYRLLRTMNP